MQLSSDRTQSGLLVLGVEGGFRRVWPLVFQQRTLSRCFGCADVEQGDEEGAEEAGEHNRLPATSCAWLRSHTVDAHNIMVQAQERKKREKLQEKERKKQEKLQKKQDKKRAR